MSNKLLKSLLVGGAFALPLSVQATTVPADAPQAPAATSAFDMTVGGTYEFYGALKTPIRKVEKQRDYGVDFFSDAEVFFHFDGKNSGWKYGAVVEFNALPGEALSSDGSNGSRALSHKKSLINADEVYAYFDSDQRGRFEFGSTDSAPSKMHYWAPNGAATGLVDGSYEDFLPALPADFVVANYKVRDSDDSLKATWFSPRWHSLQVGLSYTPNVGREGRRVDFTRILDRSVQTVTIGADKKISGLSAGAPLSNNDYKHGVELGVNYVHDFSDVSLAVSGGYTRAQPRKRNGLFFEDWQSLGAGFNLGYRGFKLGGSFVWDGQTGLYRRGHKATIVTGTGEDITTRTIDAKAASAVDAYGYSVGLQYDYKDFIFGLNYYYGQGAGNTFLTGKNEKHVVSFGTTYHLFPGLDIISELTYRNVRTKSAVENTGPIAVPASKGLSGFVLKNNQRSGDFVALTGVKITL